MKLRLDKIVFSQCLLFDMSILILLVEYLVIYSDQVLEISAENLWFTLLSAIQE